MRAPPPIRRSFLALWCNRLGLLSGIVSLLAIAGAQLQRLSSSEVLALLGLGFTLGITALVLGISALAVIWNRGLRGLGTTVIGLLVTALTLAYPAYGLVTAMRLPPINDVSTDVETPPAFVLESGLSGSTGTAYPRPFAAEQRAAYPALQPLVIDVEPMEAQRLVADSLKNLGIAIIDERLPNQEPDGTGRIEAVQTSRLLRMTDDIVIRIRPVSDSETRIDIRSRSRIGRHDLGVNAARILAIVDELTRLASAIE